VNIGHWWNDSDGQAKLHGDKCVLVPQCWRLDWNLLVISTCQPCWFIIDRSLPKSLRGLFSVTRKPCIGQRVGILL